MLEFDYVSTKRPLALHQPMGASEMGRLLGSLRAAASDDERLDLVRQRSVRGYFSAEQVCAVLRHFALPDCRVEVAVILHPRVTDLENYLKALMLALRNGGRPKRYAEGEVPSAADDREALQVLRRVGWLNIWNPLDPDVMYRCVAAAANPGPAAAGRVSMLYSLPVCGGWLGRLCPPPAHCHQAPALAPALLS